MNHPKAPEPAADDAHDSGLAWPRTWGGVYLLVMATFALWVALLVALTRAFG